MNRKYMTLMIWIGFWTMWTVNEDDGGAGLVAAFCGHCEVESPCLAVAGSIGDVGEEGNAIGDGEGQFGCFCWCSVKSNR